MISKFDFRSDTLTLPTEEMMQAIQSAKLGDDVFGEDPTVLELEAVSAKLFGKEAGLLVTSGTQGNLVSILSQTDGRGSEIIVEKDAHVLSYEVGGISALGGVSIRALIGRDGYPDPNDVRAACRLENVHFPKTALVTIENTHNKAGGIAFPAEQMTAIGKVAEEVGIGYHIDGARIFNASIALGSSVKELTYMASSVSFCLSKGLSCPIGSVIVGSAELIAKARKIRKMVGGGMRQAGIIAAPGLIALKNVNRLKMDHDNAKLLAKHLQSLNSPAIQVKEPQTNIILVKTIQPASLVVEKLNHMGILVFSIDAHTIRFVTHRMITREAVEESIPLIESALK